MIKITPPQKKHNAKSPDPPSSTIRLKICPLYKKPLSPECASNYGYRECTECIHYRQRTEYLKLLSLYNKRGSSNE